MLKILKNLDKKSIILIFLCFIFISLQVYLELKMPDYMSKITVLVQTEGSKMSEKHQNGMWMMFCALGSLIVTIFVIFMTANISASFSLLTRKKLFDKVLSLDYHSVKNFSTSSLITRTTNDITQIEMVISMGLMLMIKAPITAIWAITKIVNKSWQWSMVTAICIIVLLTTISIIMIIVIPRFKIIQRLTDKINGVTRENLTGIRVIRAFNAEKYQIDKFNKVNDDLTENLLFNQKKFAILSPMMYLVMYFLTLSIYYIGSNLIDISVFSEKISLFGDMIVFSSYAMQIIISFIMLAMIFMFLPRAGVSAKRINEVLDTPLEIIDGDYSGNTKEKGLIEFKNVSFKYPDAEEYLLKDISFTAKAGETVAIIGSTGSGKSTLINLIPRFYDVTEGNILVDGIDVKSYKSENLYNKIGYISQKAVLFSGNVLYNTGFGESKSKKKKEDLINALEIAEAKEFIEKMDNKYNSFISQGGTNISGGQKQRLSIARAIARNPEIYIFDDSFSALDYKTDARLRKKLKNYAKDSTMIIVAQRIGTIINADKIIVLDKGKCVGIGKHKDLLKSCSVYKQIAESQLSKEELENA